VKTITKAKYRTIEKKLFLFIKVLRRPYILIGAGRRLQRPRWLRNRYNTTASPSPHAQTAYICCSPKEQTAHTGFRTDYTTLRDTKS